MSFSGTVEQQLTGTIENDDLLPALDIGLFQQNYRLPGEYTQSMITEALAVAKDEVNSDLAKAISQWQTNGQTELTPTQKRLYLRGVYCRAKAFLLEQFATVTAKPSANNAGKEAPERYDIFLKLSSNAIRQLQGRGRISSELL